MISPFDFLVTIQERYVTTGNCFSTKMSVACLWFEIFPLVFFLLLCLFVCASLQGRLLVGSARKEVLSHAPISTSPSANRNVVEIWFSTKKNYFGDNWCLSWHCIGWASLCQHESILAQESLIGVKICFITFLFAVQDDLMMAGSMCWQTCHFHFFVHPCYVGESDTFVCFNRAGKQLDSCMACGIVSFLSDPGIPGVRSMGPSVSNWLSNVWLT